MCRGHEPVPKLWKLMPLLNRNEVASLKLECFYVALVILELDLRRQIVSLKFDCFCLTRKGILILQKFGVVVN